LTLTARASRCVDQVPWYAGKEWNYVRGNLSSIDRDYGIFHALTHNIGTHQVARAKRLRPRRRLI
jgi:hypothetical protein